VFGRVTIRLGIGPHSSYTCFVLSYKETIFNLNFLYNNIVEHFASLSVTFVMFICCN